MLASVRRSALRVRSLVAPLQSRSISSVAPTTVAKTHLVTPQRVILALACGSALTMAALSGDAPAAAAPAPPKSGLEPSAFHEFKLLKREHHNHNTDLFTFALADPSASLDLPVSSCLMTKTKGADGKDVVRPYTPINQFDKGKLVLMIKVYPQGVMSKHIHSLQPGDTLEMKGPFKKLQYEANKFKQIGFVAGGTGLTPCLQVIDAIIANPNDRTQVSLVFANSTPQDILLKDRLDEIARKHSNIKVTYLVDKADSSWKGLTGYASKDVLSRLLPKPSADSLVYVCGPPGFMKAVSGDKDMKTSPPSQGEVSGALKELGFTKDNVFKF